MVAGSLRILNVIETRRVHLRHSSTVTLLRTSSGEILQNALAPR